MADTFRYRRIAKTPHGQDDAARIQALTPTGASAPPAYAIPDSATIYQPDVSVEPHSLMSLREE